MADWSKILKEIGNSLAATAREANAREQNKQSRRVTAGRPHQSNICLFWDCDASIRPDHIFCYDHFKELQDGLIDECPGCNRAKYSEYDFCLKCYNDSRVRTHNTKSATGHGNRWYKPEYSSAWEKGDASADHFFVYILKLDGGQFYAGQTRELRERLTEHRDGRTKSIAGKHPKLVWFTTVDTRDEATKMEVEFKKLIDSNQREIRRMLINFRDLISELDYS